MLALRAVFLSALALWASASAYAGGPGPELQSFHAEYKLKYSIFSGDVLLDLRRRKIGVRELVTLIENAIVATLADHNITAAPKADAPGVYVDDKKIASLGLRVRRGRTFHGLAFNVDMDLEPFQRINPCGFEGLEVTQLVSFKSAMLNDVEALLVDQLSHQLAYNSVNWTNKNG